MSRSETVSHAAVVRLAAASALALGCVFAPLPVCAAGDPPDVLLIVADDYGKDQGSWYPDSTNPAISPNLEQLADEGLVFDRFWTSSTCAATRSAMLLGFYPSRVENGLGFGPEPGEGIADVDATLASHLRQAGYETAHVGKHHLAGDGVSLDLGFDEMVATRGNLGLDGGGFYDYEVVEGDRLAGAWTEGEPFRVETYATSWFVDRAIDWIAARDGTAPWFLWLTLHDPHHPLDVPPEELFTEPLPPEPTNLDVYRRKVEAMDTEIGRLLDHVPAGTTVIFLGDNGTAKRVIQPPYEWWQGKGRAFQGGIDVPMIVRSPLAVGFARTDALADVTDLFATVLELAGATPPPTDSVSLLPFFADPDLPSIREWAYSELFQPNGFGWPKEIWRGAIRDDRYKLLTHSDQGSPRCYDLEVDPYERSPLDLSACEHLKDLLAEFRE